MYNGRSPVSSSVPVVRAPGYIGPLIPENAWPLRYLAAVIVVAGTVAMRAVLAPTLGTQAPLLPFVLTVFVSAYLGGRGPALLAGALAPLAATVWFTAWPHDAAPVQWASHVAFFLLIGGLAALLMGELQRSARGHLLAARAAAESAERASESAAHMRLIADAMPALISYIGPDRIYRFANRMYEKWFDVPAGTVAGREVRHVLGEEAWKHIGPRLDRAFKGERVFFEQEMPFDSGMREIAAHYIPDIGPGRAGTRLLRAGRGHLGPQADRAHAARNGPSQGRLPRHAGARAAQSAHTHPQRGAHPRRGQADPAPCRRSAELLERQASHLTHLVDDLLDVARSRAGAWSCGASR
jgi:PAS domain-containing protein